MTKPGSTGPDALQGAEADANDPRHFTTNPAILAALAQQRHATATGSLGHHASPGSMPLSTPDPAATEREAGAAIERLLPFETSAGSVTFQVQAGRIEMKLTAGDEASFSRLYLPAEALKLHARMAKAHDKLGMILNTVFVVGKSMLDKQQHNTVGERSGVDPVMQQVFRVLDQSLPR